VLPTLFFLPGLIGFMARRRRQGPQGKPPLVLLLSPRLRLACAILAVIPLPGVGTIIAGWKNPHTRLLRNGWLQLLLVVLGAWPLVLPGVFGLAWAIWDAQRIGTAKLRKLPPRNGSDPEATAPKLVGR
jgi:hypothetical protein